MAVMTREEIMAMPAGPDIDRLVAEALGGGNNTRDFTCQHCFDDRDGWSTFHDVFCNTCGRITPIQELPYLEFSTEIHYAWKVWEAMQQRVPYVQLCQEGALVEVCITVNERNGPYITATADTAALAICRAFLVWKMEEGK